MYANRAKLTAPELMLRFSELEALTRVPMVNGSVEIAEGLAMYIARSAPNGQIANLAMLVMSDLAQIRIKRKPGADERLEQTMSELRTALREATLPAADPATGPSAGPVAARA